MKVLEDYGITVEVVNDVECIRVKDFGTITNRSSSHISNLVSKGNRLRKLGCIRFSGTPLIPIKEYLEFPFTTVGRESKVYYYNEDGETYEKEMEGEDE